jgi:hypothetical protein
MKRVLVAGAVFLVVALGSAQTSNAKKTDADEVKRQIINESLSHYRGNCPCPYNTDRAGRRCGARSAYSRPGGR